jgi:hypothetical protein
MSESTGRWRIAVESVGLGGLALTLMLAVGVRSTAANKLVEEQEQTRVEGLKAAPAPNLPGRLDGNSVGKASDAHRSAVVDRWTGIGDQVNSGVLTRVPPEVSEARSSQSESGQKESR